MAEEPDEEPEGEIIPGSSTSLSGYIILVLIILLVEGAAVFFWLDRVIPARGDGPKMELLKEELEQEWKAPLFYEKISQMVFALADSRGNRIVQVSLSLEVEPEAVIGEIEKKHQIIWDLILQIFETFTLNSFWEPEKRSMKKKLMLEINAKLKNGRVTGIHFTEFIIQ